MTMLRAMTMLRTGSTRSTQTRVRFFTSRHFPDRNSSCRKTNKQLCPVLPKTTALRREQLRQLVSCHGWLEGGRASAIAWWEKGQLLWAEKEAAACLFWQLAIGDEAGSTGKRPRRPERRTPAITTTPAPMDRLATFPFKFVRTQCQKLFTYYVDDKTNQTKFREKC